MQQSEMIELIRAGVALSDRTWADLGCGTGNFTFALRALLAPEATIVAFDRDRRAVERVRERAAAEPTGAHIEARPADVTRPLALSALDGILMANLLHFVRDQAAFLAAVGAAIGPRGRVLVVEYDQAQPIAWVPFPVTMARLAQLAGQAGLPAPRRIGYRRSPSSGQGMYAALLSHA